jgi:Xaa-Pro aminopeptidase
MHRRQFLGLSTGASFGLITGGSLACGNPPEERGANSAEADEIRRVDAEFSHLSDQSDSVQPIQAHEYAARRKRLGKILSASPFDAVVAEGGATMRYLCGMSWGHSERLFTLVVLASGEHFWLCPFFEAERAKLKIQAEGGPGGEIVTWHEHEYPFAPLAAALAEKGVDRLGIEPSLRYRFAHGLGMEMGGSRINLALDEVVELRGRKDAHEIELLRKVNELTQQGIVAASALIQPGMTGREISRLIRGAQSKLGLRGVWDLSLIGEAAAYPHGGFGDRKLQKGDVLLVDTGGSLHGYQSDNTRSWVPAGKPSAKVREVWNIVRDAQKAAFDVIRPGAPCSSVDESARDLIAQRGYGPGYKFFGHRLGHGIGTEGHEDPYFDGGSRVLMASGMTFSNEPGIYIYGEFGVRLEDIVLVTETGADHFGDWQAGPESPASA